MKNIKTNNKYLFLTITSVLIIFVSLITLLFDNENDNTSKNTTKATGNSVIQGVVWDDDNNNGSKDLYEVHLSDVDVYFYNKQGELVDFTTSNDKGIYKISGLPQGVYSIKVGYDSPIVLSSYITSVPKNVVFDSFGNLTVKENDNIIISMGVTR